MTPSRTLIKRPTPETHPYFVKYESGNMETVERFKRIGTRNIFANAIRSDQDKRLVSFGRACGEV